MSRFIGRWALSLEGRIGKILEMESTFFGPKYAGIALDGKPWEYRGSEPILISDCDAPTLEMVLSLRGIPEAVGTP